MENNFLAWRMSWFWGILINLWLTLVFGIWFNFTFYSLLSCDHLVFHVCWKGQPLIYFPRNSVIWWQSILTSIEVNFVKISFFPPAVLTWFSYFPLRSSRDAKRVTHRSAVRMSWTSVWRCWGSITVLWGSVAKHCKHEKHLAS